MFKPNSQCAPYQGTLIFSVPYMSHMFTPSSFAIEDLLDYSHEDEVQFIERCREYLYSNQFSDDWGPLDVMEYLS